jgi:pilus assembly protein CpaD
MKRLCTIAPTVALILAVGACSSSREEIARDVKTPLDQHPFEVTQSPDDTLLAVHRGGVTPTQAAAVADMVRRWRSAGGDAIAVRLPGNGPQEADAGTMGEQVRSVLLAEGVPPQQIRLERYDAKGDAAAPIAVSFNRLMAKVPECGLEWDNLTGTQSNNVPNTFGCAIRANMAAQVANPRDLIQGRAEDPYESSRGTVQTGKYRTGESTASTEKVQGGAVSNAVQ